MIERLHLPASALPGAVDAAAASVAQVLTRGGIVAFPADTVWGLGVSGGDPAALERLRALKGRGEHHPFPLYVADMDAAGDLCEGLTGTARILAAAFWPGGLTMVLPLRGTAFSHLAGPDGTVGVRVPGSAVLRSIPRLLAAPMVNTSANLTGRATLGSADEVEATFGSSLDLILTLDVPLAGAPSTVVRPRNDGFDLLREGAVSRAALEAVLQLP
jgi:L-threonylcarbamoyladenylate synthase